MPDNFISTLFSIAVSFCVFMLIVLAPPLIVTKIRMSTVAQDAAHVYAVTGSVTDAINQVNLDLQNFGLPTTWNGHTLFQVQAAASSSDVGYVFDSSPTSQDATVALQYQAPLLFARALKLIGGPELPWTVAMTAHGTTYNEVQYTGSGN